MKAVISNKIYLKIEDKTLKKEIKSKLTYKIKKDIGAKNLSIIETIKSYSIIDKDTLALPQTRLDLIPEGYTVEDKRLLVPVDFPEDKVVLDPDQEQIYNKVTDNCIINAKPGWGKSFVGVLLLKKLGQKSLVIVDKVGLRNQWVEEVKKILGFTPGIIGSGEEDCSKSITISNTQTLVKKADKFAKTFGTILVDECHHVPATTFTKILNYMYSRYRIGLSATLNRKDQKHVIFSDYFGLEVLYASEKETMVPKVHMINTGITTNGDLTWANRITDLTSRPEYLLLVADLARMYGLGGHKVLIVSDRVDFLLNLGKVIGDDCVVVTGQHGDREKAKEDIINGNKTYLAGSLSIFKEGISINPLSVVILATPINNDSLLEQVVGRIQRLHENKLNPIVVDLQFAGHWDRVQNNSRKKFYISKGWEIEFVKI